MFKKIRNHYLQKQELRKLSLDTLQKISHIVTAVNDLADNLSSRVNAFDADELKTFMENMNKLVNNPNLDQGHYQPENQQDHEKSADT